MVEPSRPEVTRGPEERGLFKTSGCTQQWTKTLTFAAGTRARARARARAARFVVCAAQFAEPLKKEEEPSRGFAGARTEEREQADSGWCRRGLPKYPREGSRQWARLGIKAQV